MTAWTNFKKMIKYMWTPNSLPPSVTVWIKNFITSACLSNRQRILVLFLWVNRIGLHFCVTYYLHGWTEAIGGPGMWGWLSIVTVLLAWSWLTSSYIWSTDKGWRFWKIKWTEFKIKIKSSQKNYFLWLREHVFVIVLPHRDQKPISEAFDNIYHRWYLNHKF
jgi:hypothetical protein